eukprot:12861.XXX_913667_913939_1 [CDS] Oithona nana genome sequencing.
MACCAKIHLSAKSLIFSSGCCLRLCLMLTFCLTLNWTPNAHLNWSLMNCQSVRLPFKFRNQSNAGPCKCSENVLTIFVLSNWSSICVKKA